MNLFNLGPLYHDYKVFGVESSQLDGIYKLNQEAKVPIITAYLQYAIAKSRKTLSEEVVCAELFCADGYYAMLSRHLGATKAYGIDNNKDGYFEKATKIAEALNLTNIDFILKDVNDISLMEQVDVVLNVGGLYHVNNPIEILLKSYAMAKKFLIIQTVVHSGNKDIFYYESPAPGWSWGCRFGRESFDNIIKGIGFNVVDSHFNFLEGNEREEDRGSLYYLIKK